MTNRRGKPDSVAGSRGGRASRRLRIAAGLWAALWLAARAYADAAASEDDKYKKAFDAAVDRALQYLARVQLKDGSFPGANDSRTAVGSLSVMAFLARGYAPGLPPYGDAIDRGVDYVLASAAPNGSLAGAGSMYCHNISALMLSEVSGMTDPERQAAIGKALSRALKLTLDAQRVSKSPPYAGGWRYGHNSADSDISHSGWALMALRSARNNGAPVPKEAIEDAAKFILRCRNGDGGFAYQPGGPSGLSRTGVGLLCLELTGRHRDEITLGAGKYLQSKFPSGIGGEMMFYCLYYCAQGMFQLGGEEWEAFAPKLYDFVLKYQDNDGSWKAMPGAPGEHQAGPCYRTAMAVLALSVTYRQLPIYQR